MKITINQSINQSINFPMIYGRHKHKLASYLKFTALTAGIILSACGGSSSTPSPNSTPSTTVSPSTTQPTVSYQFSIAANNGTPSVVTSYATLGDLHGSPTILPYKNNTTGSQDIISLTRSPVNSLIYWQSNGAGGYTSRVLSNTVLSNPWGIIGADVDADNIQDVIVQDKYSIHIIKMDAADMAVNSSTLTPTVGFTQPNFVIPVDLNNNNSAPDLITIEKNKPNVAGSLGYTIRIQPFANNGGGVFTAQPLITCSENNGNPTTYTTGRPIAADIDGDGFSELIIATFVSSATHTHSPVFVLDNVNGVLDTACSVLHEQGAIPGGLHPSGVAVADMNGDTYADIVVGNFKGSGVAIFLGNGTINGLTSSKPTYLTGGFAINGIELANLNNDELLDIIAVDANSVTPSVEIWFNKGGMVFVHQSLTADIAPIAISKPIRVEYNRGTYPIDVRVRDVNGDNKLDILTANFNPSNNNATTPTSSFSVILQK